ncbi:MAG TPA: hypothetical protein PLS66_06820 [Tepiditoga sp.]|nr:hypothetical protein [Tepiditoga sp.]
MYRKKIYLLNILIIIVIVANIYKPIENYFQWVTFPFDYAFSYLHKEFLAREYNAESLKNIFFQIRDTKIVVKDYEDLKISIPYGVIIKNESKYITAVSNEKTKKGSYVTDGDGNLIGFVENIYSERVIIRKLGWGNNEIFGVFNEKDVLIKEYEGMILIELPDDKMFETDKITINLPFYIDSLNGFNTVLVGNLISKYGNFYMFRPSDIKSDIIYFLED